MVVKAWPSGRLEAAMARAWGSWFTSRQRRWSRNSEPAFSFLPPPFCSVWNPAQGFVPPTLRECLLSSTSLGPPWQTHPGMFVLIKLMLDELPHLPADRSLTYNFIPGIHMFCGRKNAKGSQKLWELASSKRKMCRATLVYNSKTKQPSPQQQPRP